MKLDRRASNGERQHGTRATGAKAWVVFTVDICVRPEGSEEMRKQCTGKVCPRQRKSKCRQAYVLGQECACWYSHTKRGRGKKGEPEGC